MKNIFDFKSFFNFLGRNKAYTAIDIFGLSVSFMFVIIIAIYTIQELRVDKTQKNYDKLYLLANENHCGSAYRLAAKIKDRFPEVDDVCPLTLSFRNMPVLLGENKYNADFIMADTTFFDFFSFKLSKGDRKSVLAAKNDAVISESFARKVFGDKDPIGQSICVSDSLFVMVSGVMEDIKHSIFPSTDIVFRIDNVGDFNSSMDSEQFNNAGSTFIYIKTDNIAALNAKTPAILAYFKEIFWPYRDNMWKEVSFLPFADAYFSPKYGGGDWKFVMILMSIGVLILLFAIINYVNLTVAQAGFRAKEMATRRLLGSSRGELFGRMIMESTLISFVSFVLAIGMAYIAAPYAADLLDTKIYMNDFITPLGLLIAFAVVIVLGIKAGLLPASVISNAKPIEVVRGSFKAKSKMVFSKFFIIFQDIITIVLIASSITMVWQINHMQNAPLGYNTNNILSISTGSFDSKEHVSTFANEARKVQGVSRVALSQGTPFNGGNNWTTKYPNNVVSFQILIGDTTFVNMMGFKILRDNNIANDEKYYLSEQALRETELTEDSLSFLLGGNKIPIAGVIKDFHLYNITRSLSPILLKVIKTEDMLYPWSILIEVKGDPIKTRNEIEKIYKNITRLDFDGQYIDQQIEKSFTSQRRMSKIVIIFSIIAVVISLLGLLAMSTYFIQQRASEVAVRKVFGSTNSEVLKRLIWTFLSYVVIAFVISIPIIWYFMSRWLSDFHYKIDLSPLIYIVAGLFCLIISFITVFIQSYAAATANPVESFKSK
ncbi:MAG: FtsX-like permease family protein [Rikenellaceae bacterium]